MEICFFGAYDKNVPRTHILKKSLELNRIKVVECHRKGNVFIRQFKLFYNFLKLNNKPKYLFVGYYGYPEMPLAWFLSKIFRKKLIFDAYISNYDTFVLDRKLIKKDSFKSKFWHFIDKLCMNLPDILLADTIQHKKYYHSEFGVPNKKIKVLYVGTDSDFFKPAKKNYDIKCPFKVLFLGTYIPLHGTEYIIKAAKILENEDIEFKLIGKGQVYDKILNLSKSLNINNIIFDETYFGSNRKRVVKEILKSDISLGHFGDTNKAKRVITNKIFESAALGVPVLTGDCKAVKEVFTNGKDILLCEMANGKDIANKILKLKKSKGLRKKIGNNGAKLIYKDYTQKKLGKNFKSILEGL